MKKYTLCMGQQIGYVHPHPDRTAKRAGVGQFADDVFQVWPNRPSMARSIRMQEKAGIGSICVGGNAWKALVPLAPGEGY